MTGAGPPDAVLRISYLVLWKYLFHNARYSIYREKSPIERYAVTRDGERFLIVTDTEEKTGDDAVVVVNWDAEISEGRR